MGNMTPDWLVWLLIGMGVLQGITIFLIIDLRADVNEMNQRLAVITKHVLTIMGSVTTTQNSLRTRRKSDGVEPIIERPKAEQHYEGTGVKRVARGGKEEPAGGEGAPARIGAVKRRSYGGTSGDSGNR